MDNGKRSQQEAKKIKSPTSKKEERSTMKSTLFGYQCFRREKEKHTENNPTAETASHYRGRKEINAFIRQR